MPAKPDPTARTARSLAFLTLLLLTLGSCGTLGGAVGMQSELVLPPPPALSADPTDEELLEAQNYRVADVLVRSSLRKTLSGVNVVVSVLLLIAGFALARRRATASWWVVQASLANAAYAVGDTAAQAHQLWSHWGEIVTDAPSGLGSATTVAAVQALGLTLVIRLLLYGFILFRVRRPDIRRFLTSETTDEGRL